MTPEDWIGRPVADESGRAYGTLDELFVGRTTGDPEFGIVTLSGGSEAKRVAVPLAGAQLEGRVLVLPLDRDRVHEAPAVQRSVESIPPEAGEHIAAFFADVAPTERMAPVPDAPVPVAATAPVAHVPDEVDEVEVTVSEEQLVVDKASQATERVRLRKVLVEEEVTIKVTLRREELRVERIPVDAPEAARVDRGNGDAQLTEGELEFVLLAEEPVVTKRVVPVERVKVARDTIVEERRISDQVRKERVEVDETPVREEPYPA
jgi:uncharacterized protein (TIGR02271 family)